MDEREQKIDPSSYLEILSRRKWYAMIPFLVILIGGLLYCLAVPKTYKSSATISVIRQRVPEGFVQPTVTSDIDERIHSIGQEILSRTRLESLITQLNLYSSERRKLPMEAVIEKMRSNIKITVSEAKKGGATDFNLSYSGENPQQVAQVANTLTSMFIEEHLKLREEQAKGTSEFLSDELKQLEQGLSEREARLKNFKMEHMGQLPEQKEANLSILAGLQQQIESVQQQIRNSQDRKIVLQSQISDEARYNRSAPGGTTAAEPTSLEQLKENLAALQSKYTANHPDVIKTKNMIKKWVEPAQPKKKDSASVREKAGDSLTLLTLKRQSTPIDLEIKNLEKTLASLRTKAALYQARLENIPRFEQEFLQLHRDYNNLKENYQKLLEHKLEAERAEKMEERQKGEQFRVVDPARVPQMPSEPNIPKVLGITLAAALGLSVGLVLGREYLDKSFYKIDDIESMFKIPVLASIPVLLQVADLRRQKREWLAFVSVLCGGIVLASILLAAVIHRYPGSLA